MSLCYSDAKSTVKVLLTFNKVEKTKNEILDFVHLHSFLCLARHISTTIQSLRILNIPNDCSANLLNSYLYSDLCELQVVSYGRKLSLSHVTFSCICFLAFHAIIVWEWHVQSDHTRTTSRCRSHAVQAAKSVRKSLFITFSIDLVYLKKAVQSSREHYCISRSTVVFLS